MSVNNMLMQKKIYQQNGVFCLYNAAVVNEFCPEMFDASYWQAQQAITGSAQGRGTTWFIQPENQNKPNSQEWVLRHYFRGGLIGKINRDHYWFTTKNNTRPAQEFALLAKMQQFELPAPKPIAYRVVRRGLFYQADLLTSRIEQAQDLVAILSKRNLTDNEWYDIGRVIKRFHHHGIYHHDLNAHNILIDTQGQVFLIDFDRGELRATDAQTNAKWQASNMARLLRSFNKELLKLPCFYWYQHNWQTLLSGYNG